MTYHLYHYDNEQHLFKSPDQAATYVLDKNIRETEIQVLDEGTLRPMEDYELAELRDHIRDQQPPI